MFPLIQLPRKSEDEASTLFEEIILEFPLIQLPRKSEVFLELVNHQFLECFH